MKSARLFLLFLMCFVFIGGCSKDSGGTPTATGTGGTDPATETSGTTVTAIALTASPTTVSTLGTVAIAATVTNSSGASVPDGTQVSFSLTSNPLLGAVSPTATTASGLATGTFTANAIAGTVVVTVSAGGVSSTVSIPILGVDVGSIQFTSATPDVIGLKGSGQTETSILSFAVKDVNGQNASDGTEVTFALKGPNGGEFLTPLSGSTTNGVVTTTLQSGTLAGPVRVTATTTVNTVAISSISTAVSIGGGVPSLSHFTISRDIVNLAGLAFSNLQSTVEVFLADRFGNFNVLEATSVSFFSEAGAIDTSNITDASGTTSALFRTQNPMPLVYSTLNPFLGTLGISGDPVNAYSRIIAMTRGEECFVDSNGNGVFDAGTDTFPASCDIGEPFIDYNDDGAFNAATEIFVDINGNGLRDGPNTVWDDNITIWRSAIIAFTGGPTQIVTSPAGAFAVPDGGSRSFSTCVSDANANPLMAGSTVSVARVGAGIFVGGSAITIGDGFGAPTCINYSLSDGTPGDTDPLAQATIEVTVTWRVPGRVDQMSISSISGTVD